MKILVDDLPEPGHESECKFYLNGKCLLAKLPASHQDVEFYIAPEYHNCSGIKWSPAACFCEHFLTNKYLRRALHDSGTK